MVLNLTNKLCTLSARFLVQKKLFTATSRTIVSPKIEAYLHKIYVNWKTLSEKLTNMDAVTSSSDMAKTFRLVGEQEELAQLYLQLMKARNSVDELKRMLNQEQDDLELKSLVETEIRAEVESCLMIERKIRSILVKPTEEDFGDAFMEIRAGTGGVEASLFAGEMLKMYQRYAHLRGWEFRVERVTDESGTVHEIAMAMSSLANFNGVRDAKIHVQGQLAFGILKHESGIHRVQRVPLTESQGRVHTSTITVATLPALEEIIIDLPEKDLRIDSFKSSGPGGQHVNKTNSAIRVVHLPTGLSVAVQEERCAQQNRIRAMDILRQRLLQLKQNEQIDARRSARQLQIGNAGRSDKIRTYNFPQARITDHRLGTSIYDLNGFFLGRLLDEFIEKLQLMEEGDRLSQIE